MVNRPVWTELTVLDADGEKAAMRMVQEIADTTTLATLLTTAAQFASEVDDILDGKVIGYTTGVKLPTAGGTVKANPVAGCEIERLGLFTCDLVSLLSSDSIGLPAFALSKFDGNVIKLDDAEVLIFTNWWAAAPTVNRFEVLHGGNVLSGVKVFRKHRKQTKRARGSGA